MRRAVLGAVTAALLGALPASAVASPPPHVSTTLVHGEEGDSGGAPCSGSAAFADGALQVVLAAHAAVPGAAAIRLECGLVQEGVVVATVTAVGAVAADTTVVQTDLAPYSVCADIYVLYVDGSEAYDDGCP